MLNILFWNIKNNINVIPLLPKLCTENLINILILSETKGIDNEYIIRRLEETGKTFRVELPMPGNRTFLFHDQGLQIKKVKDGKFFSAFKLLNGPSNILLVTVHLPSLLHQTESVIGHEGSIIIADILKLEAELDTNKTVIVGDFNLNPFSDSMVSAYGFHAIMCKDTALKNSRTIYGEEYKYFYNPMWSLHGNNKNNVLGTYYYHTKPTSYVWNMFDQVIIRPSLINFFYFDKMEIIDMIEETSILNLKRKPNSKDYSDHLPLKFSLRLEE